MAEFKVALFIKQAEYMLLPRLTALSEVLWSAENYRDWEDFKTRLEQFMAKYDAMGLDYAKQVFNEEDTPD